MCSTILLIELGCAVTDFGKLICVDFGRNPVTTQPVHENDHNVVLDKQLDFVILANEIELYLYDYSTKLNIFCTITILNSNNNIRNLQFINNS